MAKPLPAAQRLFFFFFFFCSLFFSLGGGAGRNVPWLRSRAADTYTRSAAAAACTHSATASVVHVRVSPAARAVGDVTASSAPKKSPIATRRPTVLIALWQRDDIDAMTLSRVVAASVRWMCLLACRGRQKKRGQKPTPATQRRPRLGAVRALFRCFIFLFAPPRTLLFCVHPFCCPHKKVPEKKKEQPPGFT